MKKALVLALALSMTASVASAGGPVIIPDEKPLQVQKEKPRSGAWLPLVGGLVILGVIASGS